MNKRCHERPSFALQVRPYIYSNTHFFNFSSNPRTLFLDKVWVSPSIYIYRNSIYIYSGFGHEEAWKTVFFVAVYIHSADDGTFLR